MLKIPDDDEGGDDEVDEDEDEATLEEVSSDDAKKDPGDAKLGGTLPKKSMKATTFGWPRTERSSLGSSTHSLPFLRRRLTSFQVMTTP